MGGKDLQKVLPILLAHSQIKHQKLVCVLYGLAGVPISRSVKVPPFPYSHHLPRGFTRPITPDLAMIPDLAAPPMCDQVHGSSQCANACKDVCMQPAAYRPLSLHLAACTCHSMAARMAAQACHSALHTFKGVSADMMLMLQPHCARQQAHSGEGRQIP